MDETLLHNGEPRFAFLGGCWYGGTDIAAVSTVIPRPVLGDKYGLFRVADRQEGTTCLRSAYYLKAPIAIFQSDCGATLWEIPIESPRQVPFVGIKMDKDCASLVIQYQPYTIDSKKQAHFGEWENQKQVTGVLEQAELPRRYDAENWQKLMRTYAQRRFLKELETSTDLEWTVAAELARHYLRRSYVPCLGMHAEFMRKNAPDNVGGDELFSLPTYELYRALALFRCGEPGITKQIWEAIITNEKMSVTLPELADQRLWYNTAILQNGRLAGKTEFSSGLAGYPGGQAALLAVALELLDENPELLGEERLREGVEWLLSTQKSDGGWTLVYPTLPQSEAVNQRQQTATTTAVGATAAGVRALLWAYSHWQEKRYLRAAEAALKEINPTPPFYSFVGYGFLRDAGEYEQDGVSAIELLQANLLAYKLTGHEEWLETARALGYYAIGWQRGWGKKEHCGLVDPMVSSFAPRLALWDTMLWAEAYLDLADVTNDSFWRDLGTFTARQALPYQDQVSGGWSESWPLDEEGNAHKFYVENGISVWGLRLAKKLNRNSVKIEKKISAAIPEVKSLPKIRVKILARAARDSRLRNILRRVIPIELRRLIRHLTANAVNDDEKIPVLLDLPELGTLTEPLDWKKTASWQNGCCDLLLEPPVMPHPLERVFLEMTWSTAIEKLVVTDRLGENISSFRVFGPSLSVDIFLPEIKLDRIFLQAGVIYGEVTLKAFWNRGGYLRLPMIFRNSHDS